MTKKSGRKAKSSSPSCSQEHPAESRRFGRDRCQGFRLDLVDFATGNRVSLSREKQKELIRHLNECPACQEAFLDYENIYAASMAAEHTKTPEFRQKIADVINRLKSDTTSDLPVKSGIKLIPGEQDIDDEQHTGSAAGQIYRALKGNGKVAYPVLREKVGLKGEPFYEAVGWLLKEKKIRRTKDERTFYVFLAEPERQAGLPRP